MDGKRKRNRDRLAGAGLAFLADDLRTRPGLAREPFPDC